MLAQEQIGLRSIPFNEIEEGNIILITSNVDYTTLFPVRISCVSKSLSSSRLTTMIRGEILDSYKAQYEEFYLRNRSFTNVFHGDYIFVRYKSDNHRSYYLYDDNSIKYYLENNQ